MLIEKLRNLVVEVLVAIFSPVNLWFNFSPLTVRTTIWWFGLITKSRIIRTIVLDLPYTSDCLMRLF